jgi:hypothetical protein
LESNPGNGTLSGTTEKVAENGIVLFDDLSIEKVGKGYTLRATSPELDDAVSAEFDITSAQAVSLIKVSGDNQTGTVNAPLDEPFVILLRDEFDNPVAGEIVTFSLITQPIQAEVSIDTPNVATDEEGLASIHLTLGNIPGLYSVNATYQELSPVTFTAVLPSYLISGTIENNGEGVQGVTVTASEGYSLSVTTDDDGEFTVYGVPRGSMNIVLTPKLEGYGFIPATVLIEDPVENDIDNVEFEATEFTYTISGRVLLGNAGMRDVTVTAKGGHSASVHTDENGEYIFTNVAHGAMNVSIVPSFIGYGFLPPTYTIDGRIITDVRVDDFTAQILNFSLTGRVTHNDTGLSDVTITVDGAYQDSSLTGSDGIYRIIGVPFGVQNITVTPSKPGYLFDPGTRELTEPVSSDIADLDFTVTPPPPPVLLYPEDGVDEVRTRLKLTWNTVAGALSYGLEVSDNESFAGELVASVSGLEEPSYEVRNLLTGEIYYWRVRSINLGGAGAWSNIRSFTTTTSIKYITITSPEANAIWNDNETYTIGWESQEVDSVAIDYSLDDGGSWIVITPGMSASTPGYEWTVPPTPSTEGRIRISDTSDSTYYDVSEPFTIYPTMVPVHHSVSFGNTDSPTSYRMIGLPGNINLPIDQALSGEPKKDWTAFFDNGQTSNYLNEYDGSTQFVFKPGNGFWILSKNGFSVQKEIESVSLSQDNTYSIPIHTGWNIISNPFEIPVPWNAVMQVNGVSESLWEFNSQYESSALLEPYKGYYFFNSTGISDLKIPYPNGNGMNKPQGESINPAQTITLRLTGDGRESRAARIHLFEGRNTENESFRKYAPPGDFEELGISIYNGEVETEYKYFAEEVSFTETDGMIYTIKTSSLIKGSVDLAIDGLEGRSDYNVVLIDRKTGREYNIADEVIPSVLYGTSEREFILLIGTKTFIESTKGLLLPTVFSLAQNYPNPFNPETIIEYSIPEGERNVSVSLTVYNILGQKIRTLVDATHDAGFYSVIWDGNNDQGNKVASGLYIYTIRANAFTDIKRMMYLK